MTKQELDEIAELVVRLRKELNLHTDAPKQSNAQCGEYLKQNEQLRAQLNSTTRELEYARKSINAVPPVLPICLICHWCGSDLINCSQGTRHYDCPKTNCPATCTSHDDGHSPYAKPCTSANPVRHE